jgi:hypothetical protein
MMRVLFMAIAALAVGSAAWAQQKPQPVAPPPEQLEPAVDTTKTTPAEPAPGPAPAVPPASDSAPGGNAAGPVAAPAARTAAPRATAAAAAPAAGAAAKGPKGPDRLELETTDITGNRELPKVLYIVPWKRSDLGDLVGKPPNSLLDEVLQPIDRDVFLRENRYYQAVKPDSAGPGAGTVPASGDKH